MIVTGRKRSQRQQRKCLDHEERLQQKRLDHEERLKAPFPGSNRAAQWAVVPP